MNKKKEKFKLWCSQVCLASTVWFIQPTLCEFRSFYEIFFRIPYLLRYASVVWNCLTDSSFYSLFFLSSIYLFCFFFRNFLYRFQGLISHELWETFEIIIEDFHSIQRQENELIYFLFFKNFFNQWRKKWCHYCHQWVLNIHYEIYSM